MKSQISKLIKIVATVFILVSLVLEAWNIYLHGHNSSIPDNFSFTFWLGHIALIAHGIEGLIAASKAGKKGKNPLFYGLYTFFVGFPGLQELTNDS